MKFAVHISSYGGNYSEEFLVNGTFNLFTTEKLIKISHFTVLDGYFSLKDVRVGWRCTESYDARGGRCHLDVTRVE